MLAVRVVLSGFELLTVCTLTTATGLLAGLLVARRR